MPDGSITIPRQFEIFGEHDGSWTVTIGGKYANARRGYRMCTVIGADCPRRWDHRDKPVNCAPEQAEFYEWAHVRYEDGTEGYAGGDDLYGGCNSLEGLGDAPDGFLTYDQMIALPDPEWLVEGVIQDRTSALLFGKSNAFKSFLGIDLGCSVATGTKWHDFKVGPPVPVLYVATEGGRGVGKQRIPGWMEAHGIPKPLRQNMILYPQEIALDDDKAIAKLISACAYWGARKKIEAGQTVYNLDDPTGSVPLIVVDIFGASMNGPETSDETARAWVRNVNRIMREVGCAVLTVAHTGWADETRARMHTHFWGSFDTRLKAEGDKASLTTILSVDRHKDADSTGTWGFRLEVVDTPTGGTTLVPRLCDEVETSQKRRVSGKPAVALQALSEALIDQGRTIAGPNYPTCPVVTVEAWRAMCDRHGLTESDNPETLRKSFTRAKDALIAKGLVREFDRNVWKVNADA